MPRGDRGGAHLGRRRTPGVAAVTLLLLAAAPAPADEPPGILFRGVRVFDGERAIGPTDVRIEGGVVAAVGENIEQREGDRVHAGEGLTLLPGLVNARVHMWNLPEAWTADVERTGVGVVAAETGGDFPHNRIDALRRGVTTVVDAGAPTREIVRLRGEIAAGEQAGPRMIVSGATIVGEGGAPNRARSGMRGLARDSFVEAPDPDAARRAVARLVEAGVDFVSVLCGPDPSVPAVPASPEVVAAAVEEARASGLGVHALGACPDGTFRGAADGPDGFAGPSSATPGDGGLRPAFTPMLAVQRSVRPGRRNWTAIRSAIIGARAAGMLVLAGSGFPADGADGPGEGLLREIALLVSAGLTRREALAAATSAPAAAFGLEGVVGCIRPGCRADLVLVRGDPLSDLSDLRNVEAVFLGGVAVVEDGTPAEALEEGAGRRRALLLPYVVYRDTYDLAGGAGLVLLDPLGTGALLNLVVFGSVRAYWAAALNIVGPDLLAATRPEFVLLADNLPFTYFGFGNDTRARDGRTVEPISVLGMAALDRRLGDNLRAGVQYRFGSMMIEEERLAGLPDASRLLAVRGEYLSALNLYFEHDDRDTRSPIGGPTRGGRRLLSVLYASPGTGNPTTCAVVRLDVRQFVPLWRRHVLAFRFEGSIAAGDAPFAVMPSIGGDTNRGYYRGRFVDDASIALQAEYRFPIFWYFEGAVFYDTGRVFDMDRAPDSLGLHHSGGLGLRFNYDDLLVVRLDVGFSDEVTGNPVFQVAYPF